jgi:hypothetical protein
VLIVELLDGGEDFVAVGVDHAASTGPAVLK